MDEQNKNLILATALSFLVILVWFWLFPPEEVIDPVTAEDATQQVDPTAPSGTPEIVTGETEAPTTEPEIEAGRVTIETQEFSGSISLLGARLDDLSLTNYRETLDEESEIVHLLKPSGENDAYMALFGWNGESGAVPTAQTVWSVRDGDVLTPDTPVTLAWDNGLGQIFTMTMSVDEEFMFTVEQGIENTGEATFSAVPSGLLLRYTEPDDMRNFFILHEGLVRMADGELAEIDYDDIVDFEADSEDTSLSVADKGWIGWTDHYWMTTLIPDQSAPFEAKVRHLDRADVYIAEAVMPQEDVAPGTTATVTTRLFAGAKEWEAIKEYQDNQNVEGFIDSIDWGWFFILTKPIFQLLHWLNAVIGNMGWAIIALTVILKAIVLPLAWKSHVSMARMKELQPEMEALKEKHGDDRTAMQQATMKLYKDKKVNPAAGCLPILIQIPIFFSLYKVIFVTIELRHAPWFGWIKDLSAPDPSTIFNLFGLLPFVDHLHRYPADPAWYLDVAAAKAEPSPNGPHSTDDLCVDAMGVHVHAWLFRQRLGDLLDRQQHDHLYPTISDHAQPWGQTGCVR